MQLSATITEAGTAFAPILFIGDLADGIAKAAQIGYDAVELHLGDPYTIDVKGVKAALEKHNVALSTIGTGRASSEEGISFAHKDAAMRRKAIGRIKAFIDVFSDFKPSIIIGLIKGKLAQAQDRNIAVARIDQALLECCAYAEKEGITLLLEQANRYEQDYLHTTAEVVEVIKRLGARNLKALVDTFHMNIEECSFEEVLISNRDYIGHVHFADNNRRYPGQGMLDFPSILRCLNEIGYERYIALECLPLPDGVTAAKRAYDFLVMQLEQIWADER
jgi:sugar phosphate isomerase/epimerase